MKIMLPMLCAALDLTGQSAWDPFGGNTPPEPGAYAGEIAAVDPNYNSGKSTHFEVKSTRTLDLYIGNEPGAKGGNLQKWVQALACIAPDVDKFMAAVKLGLKFDPTTQAEAAFKGKKVYVLVKSVPGVDEKGRPNWPNVEFITKAQYDQFLAAEKAGGKAPSANGASAGQTSAAGAKAGGDVLAGLFGG